MENPSATNEGLEPTSRPKITPTVKSADPVGQQRQLEKSTPKRKPAIKKAVLVKPKIVPSMGTRIDLQDVAQLEKPRSRYVVPVTEKQKRLLEKNRKNTYKKFCRYETIVVADPVTSKKLQSEFEIPSPEVSVAKVPPRAVTPTASWLHAEPQTSEELRLKKPKSGIIVNVAQVTDPLGGYDSFDLVYSRKPRPYTPYRDEKHLDDIAEEGGESRKSAKRRTAEKQPKGEGDVDQDLTGQFMSQVSKFSQAVYGEKGALVSKSEAVEKYVQKFRRDSEIKRHQPKKRRFRRGTLESHSFTDINQMVLKEFYFGSKQGTLHQGSEHVSEKARDAQGVCIPVAAYCFSFLRHPNKWTSDNVDEIVETGSRLYLSSLKWLHLHRSGIELKPEDLHKYCVIGNKKIRFTVEDPEVSGLIRSTDKRVFNLTKALNIFFARQKAGILQTQGTNVAIWKDKYFYLFDGKARTKDLYCSPTGTAIMAILYDVPSLVTVLLQRSNLGNWPFVIYPIKVFKVLGKDDPEEAEDNECLDSRSTYNVLNATKAVLLGSFDLGDKCFGFARNKQSLPMSVVSLVYSRITPPSAWHRATVDKIMIIGNQLYAECAASRAVDLASLPAIFTIGPYIVEIYIYENVTMDMMYKKCCCQLSCALDDYFRSNANAIVQIDNCHLAVWKQRNMYFCFDPYSRGLEGYADREGRACVSMHSNLDSLIDLIAHNFDSKDLVFRVHALKVCKIHRDPVQNEHFPKHIPFDELPAEVVGKYKMKRSKKLATEKPVTVDYSALAMRRLLMGEALDASIYEIDSTVQSLAEHQIPPLFRPSVVELIAKTPVQTDLVADLDSPSLSDTQIEPPRPVPPKEDLLVPFMDLDSFELTQEEIELEEAYGESYEDELGDKQQTESKELDLFADIEGIDQVEDFYRPSPEYTAMMTPNKLSGEMNTELTIFPIRKEILYPSYIRGRQRMKSLRPARAKADYWSDSYVPVISDVTKSEELTKETNFVELPDDSQIIRGRRNIFEFGDDVEYMAPFVCIMAGVVAKKYSVLSWTGDIVDYVLKCGSELFNASKFRYDQVAKMEIPQISLGKTRFACLVEYVFDSYIRRNILELAIGKILFVRSDAGVLVTPNYACGLMYRNHLYYMYDGFGNNEVGLIDGLGKTGVACFSRFKDLRSLTTRIMYNKSKRDAADDVTYTRFVLSSVKVKRVRRSRENLPRKVKKVFKEKREVAIEEAEDGTDGEDHRYVRTTAKEEVSKGGYRYKSGFYVIEGARALEVREADASQLREDHFACLCACLTLLSVPIQKWDSKKVDEVLEYGNHVYSHADDLAVSDKRTIKNVLIGKNFFDVIVKRVRIENWRDNKDLSTGVDTLLRKKMAYFLVQMADKCLVVHKSGDGCFHVFYPHGVPRGRDTGSADRTEEDEVYTGEAMAGWLKCDDLDMVKRRLSKDLPGGAESYDFYTFEVTSIRKAPRNMLINYRLNQYEMGRAVKPEKFDKPFYEDVEWLKIDLLPWSRRVATSPEGLERGAADKMWYNWNVEYADDLYSLTSNIHQTSERFAPESRGKQTLCNLVTFIGMLEIYDFTEWNPAVMDSVLVNGDQYFHACVRDIGEQDYELSVDDLKEDCDIFPFTFKVIFTAVVEGTMFLVRNTQFNLFKALRLFFDDFDRRFGIIYVTKQDASAKKQVAFGKTKKHEYFVFDCDSYGGQMFSEGQERAYALRATTLNRLLHVLVLTLRGGDFYIYHVDVVDLKPMN
ncbi:uncharacterized protein LOC132706790 [Cylas formicarius]|uniref:uncharacterized protein LOC132706790 n=1 Tax=Cylas formicarius TaxID=197179 RepID=UPI002958D19F|nr:uncharacterized protein LOC132706790 [Cylas formicarius]XP_060534311.1 uncharacterized protein LOC132706790 [Cylas formicarius]XP_060534312.1 uncharacterized protein LOC132706790 [Cylas formicarius]